jgi:hypothetical protein
MRCFLILLFSPTLLAAFLAPLGRLFRLVSMPTAPLRLATTDSKGPFCVDCVHFLPSKPLDVSFGKCGALPRLDDAEAEYRVSGVPPILNHQYCDIARKYEKMCGERGSKFKPIKAAKGEGEASR